MHSREGNLAESTTLVSDIGGETYGQGLYAPGGRYHLASGARISTQDLNRCVAVSHRHCYADGPVTAQIRAALERLGLFFKQVFSLNFHTAFGSTTWVANRGAIGEARCCTFSRAIATTMAAAVSDIAFSQRCARALGTWCRYPTISPLVPSLWVPTKR